MLPPTNDSINTKRPRTILTGVNCLLRTTINNLNPITRTAFTFVLLPSWIRAHSHGRHHRYFVLMIGDLINKNQFTTEQNAGEDRVYECADVAWAAWWRRSCDAICRAKRRQTHPSFGSSRYREFLTERPTTKATLTPIRLSLVISDGSICHLSCAYTNTVSLLFSWSCSKYHHQVTRSSESFNEPLCFLWIES